ncbi:MAG: UDP-glucose 4-epimerase GalE [Bacteroidetes bacterium]|nr:MAG: UDP-glucose 4-epimerase GalE [Bacteroidota bacterium]TAG90560.1 MAG: UDP-glucose 4-epimerase GalE [Bacteroidota bacterium]
MPKVLLTGGLGYIGSHIAVELLNKNYEVIIIDNLSNSKKFIIENIQKITGKLPKFFEIDMCEKPKLAYFFAQNQNIDAVVHLAAFKYVNESVLKPHQYYANNLIVMLNLLEMMKIYNVTNLIFSSSCTVYGSPEKLPITEQTPIIKTPSVYGKTKQMCESFIEDICQIEKDLQVSILRYFNPMGAHESGLIGELPLGEPQTLMPFITQTAVGIRKVLKVFGNDYQTPDGTCQRDFFHVIDLAYAHILMLERLLEQKNDTQIEIFNFGAGKPTSILEVINSFEKVSNQKLNFEFAPRRLGDVEKVYADCSKAKKILNWTSQKTIDDLTSSAWQWELYLKKQDK